ncbi:MAG TPA: ABC transporter ATP-binding protein [Gemmatimonadales bacterium]|nr:ABC transporter ATP-binding protein [Gemmatimonadales bacterium]
MGADPAIIEARELRKAFGDVVAVAGVSFDVGEGELFGLVGPDGAGKTTLLRMLAGVLRPDGGDATVAGVSVARDPEGVKPSLAYMPQRFGLYADLTVRENIEFYADLYQVPRSERPARLERLYAFSRLGPFEGRLAGRLSGGMKQKLSLCCALIHRPRLLLLDEPTCGVDPVSRRELWLILHQMVAEGVTALVSTAYLDEAERCDRVALLDRGRVLALDPPARLQATLPGATYRIRVPASRRAVALLRELPGVRGATLYGEAIHLRLDSAGRWPEVERALAAAGQAALEARRIEPSLEDVFIARVRGEA